MSENAHPLKVLPVLRDPERKKYRKTHENLLSPPFRMAVIGSSKSGKCLSGDSLVQTRMGYKRIIDMDIGEYVNTKEGYKRIIDIIYNGKKTVADIRFKNGKVLAATLDHKIDTTKGLIPVQDLTKEHVVLASIGTTSICRVDNLRKQETYDLTIDNTSHTFYCQDISVSNSNYVVNLLRPDYYGAGKNKDGEVVKSCFDKIFIFSPNIGLDETTRCFRKICKESDIKQDYQDSYIQNIINSQKAKSPEEDKILIIADDIPGLIGASPRSLIFSSSSYLRHLNCSIIYISQIFKGVQGALPPIVRNNLDGIALFRCPSDKQVQAFCEDTAGTFLNKDNVKNMLDYATREPFQFAFFNYRDLNVWKNHTDKLWEKFTPDGKYSPPFVPGYNSEESSEGEEE